MRRRRDPAAAKTPKGRWVPTRRRRALKRKKSAVLVRVLTAVALIPIAAVGLTLALQDDGRPALPDVLPPEAFAPHAEFRSTDRVGTMLKATLVHPPLGESQSQFEASMHAVAARAEAAGYESVVVVSPDGTTLASGPVEQPRIQLPDHEGS